MIYRKDNREIPSITYELTAVTDVEDLIIGSALMKNCRLVNDNPSEYELRGFSTRLNTIDSKSITGGTVLSSGLTIGTNYIQVNIGGWSSWAIVTKSNKQTIQVENEDGEITTQTIELGNELVLGRNSSEGGKFYFNVVKDIYD